MEPAAAYPLDALHYAVSAIMLAVCGAWAFLIRLMRRSFSLTPLLDDFRQSQGRQPRVSVILPARNEERFVGRCMESLVNQDYADFEVVAIDDSSQDRTRHVISMYARKHPNVVLVHAKPKPDGWMGKNWACMEGYAKASGDLLLFTDADTVHSPNVISLAVSHLESLGLDALSVMPKIKALDFWTRITLPMISVFLDTRFSALNVNDPGKKTGYFFGSFFILDRAVYEGIGTHRGVRSEIIEDGALGKKAKEMGYKIRMVGGRHLVDAVWARDGMTLWNALKRLVVPIYLQDRRMVLGVVVAVAFLMSMPFFALAYSLPSLQDSYSYMALCTSSGAASLMIYAGAFLEARRGLGLNLVYVLLAPVGGLIVVSGLLSGLAQAARGHSVAWRGRTYSNADHGASQSGVQF